MNTYIIFMHNDGDRQELSWKEYLRRLQRAGRLLDGNLIGLGFCMAKGRPPATTTPHLSGYIRVRAASMRDAAQLVVGNPIYEAGGTVELRLLPPELAEGLLLEV